MNKSVSLDLCCLCEVQAWAEVVPPVCQCLASLVQGDCPEFYECPGFMVENHQKTIGKWWFHGGLMGFNQQNGDFNGMYPLV